MLDEIGWDLWAHNLEQSHLIDLADKRLWVNSYQGRLLELCLFERLLSASFADPCLLSDSY